MSVGREDRVKDYLMRPMHMVDQVFGLLLCPWINGRHYPCCSVCTPYHLAYENCRSKRDRGGRKRRGEVVRKERSESMHYCEGEDTWRYQRVLIREVRLGKERCITIDIINSIHHHFFR